MVQLNTYGCVIKSEKYCYHLNILQLDNDEYVSLEYCTLEYLIDEREHVIDNYNY
jgi:hypothetical protein